MTNVAKSMSSLSVSYRALRLLVILNGLIFVALVSLALFNLRSISSSDLSDITPPPRYQPAVALPNAGVDIEEALDQADHQLSDWLISRVHALDQQHVAARQAYDQGNIAMARDLAASLFEQRPADAKLANDLGVYQQALGDTDAAEQAFLQSIALDGDAAKPHYNLGTLLLSEQRPKEAADYLQRAVSLHPFDYQGHYNLGLAYSRSSQSEQAKAAYRQAIAVNRAASSVGAHYNLGVLLLRQQRYAAAVESFTNGLRIAPTHLGSRYNRALCLGRLGRETEAAVEYEKLLDLNPEHQAAMVNLAMIRVDQGDDDRALELLQTVMNSPTPSATAAYQHGRILLRDNLFKQAITSLSLATQSDPERAPAWYYLAISLSRSGDLEQACAAFAQACQLRPERVRYHYRYAQCLAEAGRQYDAEELYGRVIDLDSSYRKAWYNRGLLRYRRGAVVEAEEDFLSALALRQTGFAEQYMVALCKLKRDVPHEAISYLEQALEAEENKKAAYNLGLAYERTGKRSLAEEAFRRALRSDPKHRSSMRRLAALYEQSGDLLQARSMARRLLALDPEDATGQRLSAHGSVESPVSSSTELDSEME